VPPFPNYPFYNYRFTVPAGEERPAAPIMRAYYTVAEVPNEDGRISVAVDSCGQDIDPLVAWPNAQEIDRRVLPACAGLRELSAEEVARIPEGLGG